MLEVKTAGGKTGRQHEGVELGIQLPGAGREVVESRVPLVREVRVEARHAGHRTVGPEKGIGEQGLLVMDLADLDRIVDVRDHAQPTRGQAAQLPRKLPPVWRAVHDTRRCCGLDPTGFSQRHRLEHMAIGSRGAGDVGRVADLEAQTLAPLVVDQEPLQALLQQVVVAVLLHGVRLVTHQPGPGRGGLDQRRFVDPGVDIGLPACVIRVLPAQGREHDERLVGLHRVGIRIGVGQGQNAQAGRPRQYPAPEHARDALQRRDDHIRTRGRGCPATSVPLPRCSTRSGADAACGYGYRTRSGSRCGSRPRPLRYRDCRCCPVA